MSEQAKCRSCGAAIIWARTENGKAAPLNADISDKGNLLLGSDGIARVVPAAERGSVMLYTNHFATCPNAAQHRKQLFPGLKESKDAPTEA